MTAWRYLVNFLLPPPCILGLLLALPLPRNAQKGVLLFTQRMLAFPVLGGLSFVHFAFAMSGLPLIDSGVRTFRSAAEARDHELTPNQRVGVLAKKWREERNFWIAAMAFSMWCMLTVLYAHVGRLIKAQERADELQDELDELRGVPKKSAAGGSGGGVAAAAAGAQQRLKQGLGALVSNATGAAAAATGRAKKEGEGPSVEAELAAVGGDTAARTTAARRRAA